LVCTSMTPRLETFLSDLLQRVVHPPNWLVVDATFHALARDKPALAGLELVPLAQIEDRLRQGLPPQDVVLAMAGPSRGPGEELRACLARHGSSARVHDAKHDGLAALIARKRLSQMPRRRDAPKVNYVIFCAPRSGSTLLTELLTGFGIGEPREHIRPELIQMLRAGDDLHFDVGLWLSAAQAFDRTDDIFGTKVVMHLLRSAATAATPEQFAAIRDFTESAHLIHLTRRDKVDQALSQDRARETSVFHVFEAGQLEAYRQRSEAWSYDFDRIKKSLDQVLAQEEEIHHLIRQSRRPVHRVEYDSLVASPEAEVAAMCRFIGVEPRFFFMPRIQLQRLADEKSRAFQERFMAEHLARLGRPAEPEGSEGTD